MYGCLKTARSWFAEKLTNVVSLLPQEMVEAGCVDKFKKQLQKCLATWPWTGTKGKRVLKGLVNISSPGQSASLKHTDRREWPGSSARSKTASAVVCWRENTSQRERWANPVQHFLCFQTIPEWLNTGVCKFCSSKCNTFTLVYQVLCGRFRNHNTDINTL